MVECSSRMAPCSSPWRSVAEVAASAAATNFGSIWSIGWCSLQGFRVSSVSCSYKLFNEKILSIVYIDTGLSVWLLPTNVGAVIQGRSVPDVALDPVARWGNAALMATTHTNKWEEVHEIDDACRGGARLHSGVAGRDRECADGPERECMGAAVPPAGGRRDHAALQGHRAGDGGPGEVQPAAEGSGGAAADARRRQGRPRRSLLHRARIHAGPLCAHRRGRVPVP